MLCKYMHYEHPHYRTYDMGYQQVIKHMILGLRPKPRRSGLAILRICPHALRYRLMAISTRDDGAIPTGYR